MYGFGSLITLIFTEARALDDETSFLRISLSSFNSDGGGRKGRLLYGLLLSNICLAMVVQKLKHIGRVANLCPIIMENKEACS